MDPPNPDCDGCAMRRIPINTDKHFGHTKCTFHRECTGRAYWEPDACGICLANDRKWATMDPINRYSAMGGYAAMLEASKAKINNAYPMRNWDHVPIMNHQFARHKFNMVKDSPLNTSVHTESPLQGNSSDSHEDDDDDCLIIEPEQNAFNESGSNDSADDLRSSIAHVNSLNQMLTDVCTELHCINSHLSAQCNDPVHAPQIFAPHANSTPHTVHQQPLGVSNISPQVVQPIQAQCQAALQPHESQIAAQQQPPLEPYIFDIVNIEHWFLVNPAVHTYMGGNKLKIKALDPITGIPVERVACVKYKTAKRQYFQVDKNQKADDVWIANTASFSAFSASLNMNPSTSHLLSETNYLDSYIGEDSGLRKALQELSLLSNDITRLLLTNSLEATIEHFDKHCKLFSIHSFINFTAGFELTNKSFDRLLEDKVLKVFNFEKQVGAPHGTFEIKADLNGIERRTRKHMLHTISTVHLMEEFVGNVERVDEKEREKAKLHVTTGQGINKRMLANVEIDTLHWMKAKMDVRLSLLTNMENIHAQEVAASTLWDPDVFSDEAMAKLAVIANNKSRSVQSLLGIQGNKRRESCTGQQLQNANPAQASQEPPNKRFKYNNQPSTSNSQTQQVYYTKRGNRGGKRHNKNKYNNNNNGKNRQHQQKQRYNKGNNKGKPFPNKKRDTNK